MRVATALPWLALAGVVGYVSWHDSWPRSSTSAAPSLAQEYALPNTGGASTGPVSYAPAVSRAAPAVVNIYTTQKIRTMTNSMLEDPWFRFHGEQLPRERTASSLGSGVIVSSDGYILTNDHVVASADSIVVALRDGREVAAKVIGTDPDTDLAVLKVQLDKLPVLPFKTSESAVGDVVLAIGNPFGVGQTVTQGIISAIGRSGLGINTYEDFIQTDAAINPGNSGGALVDVSGNLIGVNSAIYSRSGGSMGIGFAIPAPLAKQVMQDIISQGHVVRGWLGIEIGSSGDESRSPNGQQPIIIAGVMPGGPGERGGLQAGDELKTVMDVKVTSADQVIRQIASLKPKTSAEIEVLRDGKRRTLTVTMGERPKQRSRDSQK
ncbi:MAG: trypsin-like peptidase domain-containing protein [Pseudomonadota bacterium]